MLPEIATLWIGGRLSWLEQLCLKSFADAGHHTTVYSYTPIENIPEGVHAADAELIFPSKPLLCHVRTGSPAIHADIWRLHLLKKTDKIWVDADMYCYRCFDFTRKSVFGWEKEGLICNAVLGLSKTSRALNGLLSFFQDEYAIAPWLETWQQAELKAARDAGQPVHMTEQNWGFTGPAAVTWFLKESGESKYAEPQTVFYPISFKDRNKMILSKFDIDERLTPETRGIHFWARRMKPRLQEKEDNTPRRGSFMDKLIHKHGIDTAAAPIPRKSKPKPSQVTAPNIADLANDSSSDRLLIRLGAQQFTRGVDAGGNPPTPPPHHDLLQNRGREILDVELQAEAFEETHKTNSGAIMVEYDELIETLGIKIPFDPNIITPKIERPMRNNRYEGAEVKNMQDILQPGDRVLEIGSGVGLVATVASKCPDVASVTTVEANPGLIPLIKETFRINDVQNVALKNAVVSASKAKTVDFYLRADFWASSMEPDSRAYVKKTKVTNIHIKDLVKEVDPTVISCDIEGAELGLFDEVNLENVRHAVLELHPKVYGAIGVRNIVDVMASKGFRPSPDNHVGGSVKLFDRICHGTAKPPKQLMPLRSFASWPPANPKVLVVTCMKDEGPFILEWIAWHRALGVTDFIVFTNDCTDGTDAMLDRLNGMGIVTHLPNPAQATHSHDLQPIALRYAHYLQQFSDADFVISIDVDEFINVRTGRGQLADLFKAVGDFDVLSMSELNHGSNKLLNFEPGWVRNQFPLHESESPGGRKAHRGVKSITRLTPRVKRIRNHRPDMDAENGAVRWLDGSGRKLTSLLENPDKNGVDVRGTYDLVSLDHFSLRSLDSYLVKMFRGDVVVKNKQVSQRYWRLRNGNERGDSTFDRLDKLSREAHDKLMSDKTLARLHEFACDAHCSRIKKLKTDPHFLERRDWILENAWE